MSTPHDGPAGIAIIGMSLRFPGARTVEEFWRNLRDGVEAVTFFSAEELRAAGVPETALADPSFVKAAAVLDGVELFDATFFGFHPREAEIMDPQQRLFLECAWQALEDAGHDAARYDGDIGLFAGAGLSSYLLFNVMARPDLVRNLGGMQAFIANDKDYLTTRASFLMGLTGPSMSVQTACSTSLVAVHVACQSLLDFQCDMALAGGAQVQVPQVQGYRYADGGIVSPDGHTRTFDERSRGTVFGSGVGVVVLKRLADALEDGDTIRAVVRGSAVNNDGSAKVGYTAPSVEGQARVISEALAVAEVEAETISYVEAHGTGTPLGDPIEVEALRKVFAAQTRRTGFCALGSVKTNVGHLNSAAGIAGLIKTVLALEHRQIPPSLHFERPNPQIDFASSPFYVQRELADWPPGAPRRAGVSSFGIGGTNAHAVIEEAPAPRPSGPSRPWQLLVLSARSATALETATEELAGHLERHRELPLADVAFTLQRGRRVFEHRRTLVCREHADALAVLAARDPERLASHAGEHGERPVVFLFPGQGAQYVDMGRDLYRQEDVFRAAIDRAAEILRPHLDTDLRRLLYPGDGGDEAGERLRQTAVAQPALFAVEYALAKLWTSWGVAPEAMLGHSVGEYVAACLAGVFALEDALALVAARGRLMQSVPRGAMVSVALPAAELEPLLGEELELAAVNAPALTVVAGTEGAVEELRAELAGRGLDARRLRTSHAFHTRMMEPILGPFRTEVAARHRNAPEIPFLSNLTGTWIEPGQATDPDYWVEHLRRTVRFADGLAELHRDPRRVLLEVGPGRTLATLARRHGGRPAEQVVLGSLPPPERGEDDQACLLKNLGQLWLTGLPVDWESFYRGENRRRVRLPTYPFERRRYWIDPPRATAPSPSCEPAATSPAASDEAPPAATAHPRPLMSRGYAAATSEVERTVVEIWQELMGIEPIGIHDDFFELGGHSLLATELTARLSRACGVRLALRELLEDHPTPARLAARVEERRAAAERLEDEALPALVPDPQGRGEPFPLTDVQHAYWVGRGSGLELGDVATHAYFEIDFDDLEVARFEAAWRRVVARHDMLRAIVGGDGRQQVLGEVPPYEVRLLELPDDEAEAERRLLAVRAEMSHQVLPADRWPLFEIRASRFASGQVRLHVSFDFLIGDAWSLELLRRDLGRCYADPEAAMPALGVSFRDYVVALRELEGSEPVRRSLEYWRRRLATLPPGPELPLAKSPTAVERPRFVRRAARLDAGRWEKLKERARIAGLTPSGLVAAAFAEALAAWSKAPRFTLNLTLFNRLPLHPQVHEVVGDFTSLTLLEVDSLAGACFEERAQRLQRQLWDDLDHRYVSGVRVLRELGRGADGAGRTLMPVVFTSTLTLGTAAAEAEEAEAAGGGRLAYSVSQTPQVWLDHQVGESAAGLHWSWDAVEELFPPGLLDDMFAAYGAFLERLAEDGASWSAGERRLVPEEHLRRRAAANATAAAIPEGLLVEPFAARAREDPERPALIAAGRTLGYGELARLAWQLGGWLRERGALPNTLVAVVMEKGWEQAAAVLGVQAAGAAYLPVDAGLPEERRRYLLEHGLVRLALTQSWLLERLEWPPAVECLAVDTLPGAEAEPPPWIQEPRDLAYVIFTSGSTGLPKGVMIDHRGALNTIADLNQRFAVTARDRVLQISALHFDLSVYDVFGLLAAGGAVVYPEAGGERDPAHWLELARRHEVTIWNTVPALMEMLVTFAEGRGEELPPSLRLVMLSGDWIPLDLPGRVRRLAPAAAIRSLGGATEASIWSILHPVDGVDPAWRSIPYGKPLLNQTFQVLDSRLEPCPEWVPGELFIGGVGLARGYWRDEAKTAASFITHPRTGERLYRTGDLGRYFPDGTIEFLGREDFQVKVRGHRIELGEIEAALVGHPAVRTAVAAARGERFESKRLVAYVVPEAGAAASAEALTSFLAAKLPAHMVPAAVVVLDELPLTATGKVDRRALPEPGDASPQHRPRVAPRTAVEETVAGIWEDALGVERVGLDDDFYALGGDSLLATRIVARLRDAFGVEVSLRRFFAAPRVENLARAVEEARGIERPPLEPLPRGRRRPLSFAQERMWFLHQLEPESAAYHLPAVLGLRGRLDAAALERAFEAVIHRHETLRSTFPALDGEPFLAVTPPALWSLPRVDLAALPEAGRQRQLRRLAADDGRRRFDLARGPLLRACLLRLAAEEHVLLFNIHHIVSDGWSNGVLVRELGALYGAFLRDEPSPLPELAVHYADFAAWQRAWLAGGEVERQLAYWREQLRGAPAVLALPTDRPPPPRPSGSGGYVRLRLGAADRGAVRALGRERGATLFMTLLAAWTTVLARHTHQHDVVVGAPIAGRGQVELEWLIGFFVNTLMLRADLAGEPTFAELLDRLRDVTLEAYAHQDVPFEKLVAELRPRRQLDATPFFQVMLTLQNAPPLGKVELPGLTLEPLAAGTAAAMFDLTLFVTETDEGLHGTLEFARDLFDETTAARLARRFSTLLAGAAADPRRRLTELPLASGAELHQLLVEWNDTAADLPAATIPALVHAQARRHPERVALTFDGPDPAALTYGELAARAGALAEDLRRRGVSSEVRVAISVERSLAMLVGLLGILEADGAYVPLDPEYPRQRLRFMLEDCGAPVLVTERRLAELFAGYAGNVVVLDGPPTRMPEHGAGRTDRPADSLAYVIYTSGSTGRPKGVMNSHRGIVNRLLAMPRLLALGSDDRVLQKTPISFDVSVWELFLPLVCGAQSVIARPGGHRDPTYLARSIAEHRVTTVHFVPSMLQAFVGSDADEPHDAPVPTLRRVIASGEALPADLGQRFLDRFGASLFNCYGPTEAAVEVTAWRIRRSGGAPIGRPGPNVRIHVVDRRLRPVPIGVHGELLICGVQVARGYLGRGAGTAEVFCPDPWGPAPGTRLYRTGDLVRYRRDGALDFLGRIDFQVKVRGMRIELGEIETGLADHPGIREAVVMARERTAGDWRLVAFVVAAGEPVASAELRRFLAARLPEYMVPSAFVTLDEMPLNPNGKADRRALAAIDVGEAEATSSAAPRGPRGEVLARLLAELLGTVELGAGDDFFARGGHSLLAARAVARIRQLFQVELSLRELFENPTVDKLLAVLDRRRGRELPDAITPRPQAGPCRLSFAQERLWFLEQLEPGSTAYNIPGTLHFSGKLDAAALSAALGEIQRRHESLRTRFDIRDGEPVQIVEPAVTFALPVVDLGELARDRRAREAERRTREVARLAFDLGRGPLLRALLLRLGREEHQLVFSMHHIVSDGWSFGVLLRELSALYTALVRGERPTLPELPIQYADFARWQRQHLRDDVLEQQAEWWRRQLDGAPTLLELPTDRPRPPVLGSRGGSVAFTLPGELAAGLTALGRRRHATPFMMLLASLQLLLARWSGASDLTVGSPVANRDRVETENLIGFFLNTLVFRLRLDGGTGFLDLLSRVVETALGAYAHQDLPFERLVDELRPPRSLSHSALFQVLFVHQPRPAATAAMGDLTARSSWTVNQTEKFDLTLSLIGDERGFAGLWRYSADLFDATTVRRLRRHFETLLASVVAEPQRPVGELHWMARSERHQLLGEWNDTVRERPATTLDGLVLAGGALNRDAVALVFEPRGREMSRAELDRGVETLARELRRRGVVPESRVAICLERSPEMAVASLAVLRSGGAYVPLDPTHPEERRAHLLESTGALWLVTRRGLRAKFPRYRGEVLLLDELPAAGGEPPLVAAAGPDHLAYVVHTSGSSGEPKGVGGLHRAAAAYLEDLIERTGIGQGDVVLQLAGPSFDASLRDLLGPLAAGSRVVLVDEETAKDPSALLDLMRRRRVTALLSTVPTLLAGLFQAGEEDGGRPIDTVRLVLASGEALPRASLRRARRLFGPRVRLVNQYGPTECTMTSTAQELRPSLGDAGMTPIGRGIANVAVHVLDRRLQPQGIASPGELFLAGPGLTRGYLGRPAATAATFLPDPWSDGGRLYRTGDRGRRLADGTLEFLGRLDRQIKLRGVRLEPGEVEAALLGCPPVREAAVVLHDGRLVAYVVAGEAVDGGALRQALRRSLPEHAVPAAFVALARLPRTPTGKLDRRALPAPEAVGLRAPAAPRGWVEETLAAIWSEVLERDGVGAGDDFFELGGHSLAATRVLSRLRRVLGVEVPLRQLFETPTIAGLGAWIEERRRREQGLEEPPLVPVPRGGPAPLTFSQQRLWFIDRLTPGNPVYNVALTVRLEGRLDVPAFAATLGEIVRRHEVLRTRFTVDGGDPVQIVEPAAAPGLPLVDLSALGPRRRRAELSRRLTEHAERPFDLGRAPLLRTLLLRLDAGAHAAGVAVHHIVFDGWSIGVLVREVAAIYGAYCRRRPSPLAMPALQYADYAHWQRRWLVGDVLERQLAWWRSRLAGVPALELPADRPRPPVQTYRGARTRFELSAELSAALRELGRRAGATPFMTSLAAFAVLLGRLSGQPDVAVGTAVAGRTRPQIEDLIGFFVNTLALRIDLRGEPGFSEVLARVREAALAADAHQDLPFEKLVEELRPAWDPSRQPLFQVMLVYHNTPSSALELPGLVLRRVEGEVTRATFDLTLALSEMAGRLVGLVDYNVDLFDPTTARRLVSAFRALLGGLAGGPGQPIARLPLLDSPARHQLLVEWNDSGQRLAAAPERLTLHGLFEAQAAATPAAAALVWEDGVASYAELDARADALAGRLRHRGIGPGDVVGLHTDRSPEMVVAMLAVMKAGAAYAPLDPGLPRERLARVLDDGGVRLVLTRDAVRAGLPENGAAAISLDAPVPAAPVPAAPVPAAPVPAANGRVDGGATADDLAYVIYTSGTSGRPKGVMVPHRGVATTLLWRRQAFGLGPQERVLQNIPFTFDPSLWQIFGPLVSGGRTVLAPPDAHRDLARLGRYMAQRGITITDFPPSVLEVLLGEGYLDAASALRLLFVGAEVLPVSLHDRFLARHRAELQNIYGPTEASIDATTWRCRPEPRSRRVPIGRPAAGKEVFLLDLRGAPVPAGVPAELHVGGELARGYLGQPRLTAASFVPDGTSGATGGRLYRTGDLARHRADGAIEFLGREDLQVKVRGIRIELEEIEAVLGSHPQVREAAVAVRGEPAALVAYVAGAAGEPSPSELRSFLEQRLPAYMVPGKWVTLEALARTAHGKVDRAALPEPADESSGRLPQAPRDPTELALVEIWEELLSTSPIGIGDEFFELGGHSLLAVRMVARIEERLGCELTLAAFLRAGTIESLAAVLRGRRAPAPSPLVALRPRGSRPPFFCVHPAGGLVFSYLALARRLGREQPFYALQNPSWYEPGEPEFVIEARAARYLEAIEEVEPEGPYLLGGWSLGGVVAFEMACQLAAQGRGVALLALIDVARRPVEEAYEDLLLNYARHLGLPLAAADLAGLSEDRRLERFLAEAQGRGRLPPGVPVAQARRFLEIFQSEVRAQKSFVPRALPHRVVVLRAAARDDPDPDLGWGAVSAGVDVHLVPGDHESLLTEPHVEALAACLGSAIDRAVGPHEPAVAAHQAGLIKTL